MDLQTLLPALAPRAVRGPLHHSVTGVSHDSRHVGPTDLFVAIRGEQVDGRRFARTLACAGVISDGPVAVLPGVPVIEVADPRRALAQVAAALFGRPARQIPVVGITGTNGKTTTAHLLEATLQSTGRTGLLLGTTGHRMAGRAIHSTHTTPEAPVIQALLAEAASSGCQYAVMEVSSIGLELRRVDAIPFQVTAFTSFSQDHLDFHTDMETYFAAKARLFHELLAADGIAVLHADDPTISALRLPNHTVLRYGRGNAADVQITDTIADLDGCRATVTAFGQSHALSCPLVGAHNLENAVCAFTIALALGVPAPDAIVGLGAAPAVPGRLQPVPRIKGGPSVFVDYAHTPDALTRVLGALRPLTAGEIHTVFGCGGDRDRAKRPHMGRAAQDASDRLTITSDNPRTEQPQAIVDDIARGLTRPAQQILDRRQAIYGAIAAAGPDDVVLIAGKGHETTQTIGTIAHPFDDVQVASEALARRIGAEP